MEPDPGTWPWIVAAIFVPAIVALVGFIVKLLTKVDKIRESQIKDAREVNVLLVNAQTAISQSTDMVRRQFENPSNRELLEAIRGPR